MEFGLAAEGLIENWQEMSSKIDEYVTKPRHANIKVFDSIDRDINQFVALLKALAPMRSTFKTVLSAFISHDKVWNNNCTIKFAVNHSSLIVVIFLLLFSS